MKASSSSKSAAAQKHGSTATRSKSWPSSGIRFLLADLPLMILFGLLCTALILQNTYTSYIVPIIQSYERTQLDDDDFIQDYDNEFTYYNRHCGPADISTTSAADLLVPAGATRDEAATTMLTHGAVAVRNVLSNETAIALRSYLVDKHHNRALLGYNEIFWDEISRMSLGIGTSDHPTVIADALREVGTHATLQRTLEGIVGPDPAIVEISTLTSLNGATDQGIHTDSDFFGSSLLYSRSFLHSYSIFIALQDTSQELGATTVCPGTHYCADPDLEELCLEHGAFEISTNGETGDHGMFHRGDAFLFNQNIWHRGPQNRAPKKQDRFMFIMTFASAKDIAKANAAEDRRRQGLGTYYYQRFNMWGATHSMLKDATTTMIQPFAGMRALGWTYTRGVTWIHQFCQQMANGDEFYSDYELPDLQEKVFAFYKVPDFLRSHSETWESFIPETVALWIQFLTKVNAAAVAVYCVMCVLVRLVAPARGPQFPSSLLSSLGAVALMSLAVSKYIETTQLAQSVITGDVFARPFPSLADAATPATATRSAINTHYGPTTFPERNDVLITTRFDADFLGSFNRFVDFHPGNRQWQDLISAAALLPDMTLAAEHVVRETLQHKESGLPSRFLWQHPETGAWSAMSNANSIEVTMRAVLDVKYPLVGKLSQKLKYMLADSRFGRPTAMARRFSDIVEPYWSEQIYKYARKNSASSTVPTNEILSTESEGNSAVHINRALSTKLSPPKTVETTQPSVRPTTLERFLAPAIPAEDPEEEDSDDIEVGSKVWVYFGGPEWYEGELVDILDEETCIVFFFNSGGTEEVHPDDLKEYVHFTEGDRVEVDYSQDSQEFFPGVITNMHPDGRCTVRYDDGEVQDKIGREYLIPL